MTTNRPVLRTLAINLHLNLGHPQFLSTTHVNGGIKQLTKSEMIVSHIYKTIPTQTKGGVRLGYIEDPFQFRNPYTVILVLLH